MMITKQQMMITNQRIRNTLMITKQRNTQIMITKTKTKKTLKYPTANKFLQTTHLAIYLVFRVANCQLCEPFTRVFKSTY